MPTYPIPPEFRKVTWSQLQSGQAIWYCQSTPRPFGPWIVVDPARQLIRPLNSGVQRVLKQAEVLIRPDAPPPKAEK